MNIVVLSRKPELYSTQALAEAAKERGHHVRIIDPLRCYMNITSNRPSISYKGEKLTDIDAVIPRIGASITFYGTAVVRQFEMMGVYCLNESVAITRSRDKLRSLATAGQKRHRTSRDRFRPFHHIYRRSHRNGGRRAPGGQAA